MPGVTVTAVGPAGTLTTVTGSDGTYSFPLLPAGDYEVTVTTPDGYLAAGPTSRSESVAADDVANVDFELARTGSVEGVVETDDGSPVPDVMVSVTGPDGTITLTTGADGDFALGELPPGDYTVTLAVPDGYTAVGPTSRPVTITAAGEAIAGQDFVLQADATIPTPPPSPTPGSGSSSPGGTLPATGVDAMSATAAWSASLAIAAGAMLLLAGRARRRAPR